VIPHVRSSLVCMTLTVNNVGKSFEGLDVLRDISIGVNTNEIFGIIGPNGSGKTTLLNLISGLYSVDSGTIYLDQERIDRLKPFEIARRGIARTFQVVRPFPELTVEENLLVPALGPKGMLSQYDKKNISDKIAETLDFVSLTRVKNERAGKISGGQQKLLEFARVLMLNPKVILLDEITEAVHPILREKLAGLIKSLKEKTFVLVSHDESLIMSICHRVAVLSAGKKIAEGTPNEIRNNEGVLEAYLGR